MDESILIVSSNEATVASLSSLLKSERPKKIDSAASGALARRRMLQGNWDIVLVNTPLQDEFGDELALAMAEATGASVVLMVKSEGADEMAGKLAWGGVLVLPKPVGRQVLYQTVKMARVMHDKLAVLRRENEKLQKRIEELRVVDRAKCALIQYRSLTEQEAHKFIEREAMDGRITRKQVAEELVRTFEG